VDRRALVSQVSHSSQQVAPRDIETLRTVRPFTLLSEAADPVGAVEGMKVAWGLLEAFAL